MNITDLQILAEELHMAEQDVIEQEKVLTRVKEHVRILKEETIPDAMDDLGMDELKTKGGFVITVEQKMRCGKVTNPAALQWLIKNGHSGLIKSDVQIPFGREDIDAARHLIEQLEGEGLQPRLDEHVHQSTAASFLRGQLEEGVDVDLRIFGAQDRSVAKVTLPKRKKQ